MSLPEFGGLSSVGVVRLLEGSRGRTFAVARKVVDGDLVPEEDEKEGPENEQGI